MKHSTIQFVSILFILLLGFSGCGGNSTSNTVTPNQVARTTISASGGTVVLPNIAAVTFPAGAFPDNRVVSVSTTQDPATAQAFTESTAFLKPSNRSNYEIRINIGKAQLATQNYDVVLNVPEDFLAAVPPNFGVRAFAQV